MKGRTIVFVKSQPQIRIFKEAYGLKQVGDYRLILLCKSCDEGLFKKVFDEIHIYGDLKGKLLTKFVNKLFGRVIFDYELWMLRKKVSALERGKVDLFHVHAEPNIIPAEVIRNTEVPVVYDAYDLSGVRFGLENLDISERQSEKYSLENANGIVLKFPESILNYYREHGYKIEVPFLNYIDYCLPEYFFDNSSTSKDITPFHLAYAGVAAPNHLPKESHGNNQYWDIISGIIKQEFYYHLYINPWQLGNPERDYSDYIKLDSENPYFKMHFGKEQPELQKELSGYHFGCQLHDLSKTRHTKLFEETSFGNKFSTYLEAGLPIIVGDNLKLNKKYVEEYEVGFSINLNKISELSKILGEIDYNELKKNVRKVREGEMNIVNNAYKLADFYEEILRA